MAHTLSTLAVALRGVPRDAPILVQLPDGGLAPVQMVKVITVGADVTQPTAGAGRTGIVLQTR